MPFGDINKVTIISFKALLIEEGLVSLRIIPQPVVQMFEEFWKKIRKWYQTHVLCLRTYETPHDPWKDISQQAKLANEIWYVETNLATPARDSLSNLSDG